MKKAIIITVCMCMFISYFLYISYYTLEVTYYEIETSKISENINIVMIADVHDFHCRVRNKVISRIEELDPDIILCAGDIIDDQSKDSRSVLDFLQSLINIADVYMSIGNHELDYCESETLIKEIRDAGIYLLDKEYMDIKINSSSIRIGGLYDYAFSTDDGKITQESMHNSDIWQFLNAFTDTSSFKLMMSHRPDSFIYGDAYKWNIDLIVSGHTHGGQIILPFIGGLYAPEQGFFPKYDYGEYSPVEMKLIVTRGIGSSDEILPRFNNPPEIVFIALKGE